MSEEKKEFEEPKESKSFQDKLKEKAKDLPALGNELLEKAKKIPIKNNYWIFAVAGILLIGFIALISPELAKYIVALIIMLAILGYIVLLFAKREGIINEFFEFKKLILPMFIKIFYSLGFIVISGFSISWIFARGFYYPFLEGIALFILGNVLWRVFCETAMLGVGIFNTLNVIEKQTKPESQ